MNDLEHYKTRKISEIINIIKIISQLLFYIFLYLILIDYMSSIRFNLIIFIIFIPMSIYLFFSLNIGIGIIIDYIESIGWLNIQIKELKEKGNE